MKEPGAVSFLSPKESRLSRSKPGISSKKPNMDQEQHQRDAGEAHGCDPSWIHQSCLQLGKTGVDPIAMPNMTPAATAHSAFLHTRMLNSRCPSFRPCFSRTSPHRGESKSSPFSVVRIHLPPSKATKRTGSHPPSSARFG